MQRYLKTKFLIYSYKNESPYHVLAYYVPENRSSRIVIITFSRERFAEMCADYHARNCENNTRRY